MISKRLVQVIRGLLFLNKISNSNLINKTDHCQEILPQINTFKYIEKNKIPEGPFGY